MAVQRPTGFPLVLVMVGPVARSEVVYLFLFKKEDAIQVAHS